MLTSGNSGLMSQAIVLFVICVLLKQPSPPFGLGYISMWKITIGRFSTHWVAFLVLSYVSVFLPYLCSSGLIFLIHTHLPWNYELVEAGPRQVPQFVLFLSIRKCNTVNFPITSKTRARVHCYYLCLVSCGIFQQTRRKHG